MNYQFSPKDVFMHGLTVILVLNGTPMTMIVEFV